MRILVLKEVNPITGDSLETAGYRTCDFCEEGPWGVGPAPLKTMYQLPGGEIVCDECLVKLLNEEL